MKSIFSLFLCLLYVNSYAGNTSTWSCQNTWAEISCHAEHCQFETEHFTPFRIHIENQKISAFVPTLDAGLERYHNNNTAH